MVLPDRIVRRDCTAILPVELLMKVLSDFTFDELLPVLAVSTLWRASAIGSPGYWSHIHLDSTSDGAVRLFLVRISRSGSRPIILALDLVNAHWSRPDFDATVFNALRRHMHHVVRLLVFLYIHDVPYLWRSLSAKAPALLHLEIHVYGAMGKSDLPSLPFDLFDGQAPSLRTVSLKDVDLPSRPILAFSGVEEAEFISGFEYAMPDVFPHFARLNKLELPFFVWFEHTLYKDYAYRGIETCVLRAGRGDDERRLPLSSMRLVDKVLLHQPRPQDIEELLLQLRPPLDFAFLHHPEAEDLQEDLEFSFTERDAAGRRQRSIVDNLAVWSAVQDTVLHFSLQAVLAGRVRTLTIDASCWIQLAECLPDLAGLQCLRIFIRDGSGIDQLVPIASPVSDFTTLEFASDSCLYIPAAAVLAFVLGSFEAPAIQPCTIGIENIHVSGDSHAFHALFREVRVEHRSACSQVTTA